MVTGSWCISFIAAIMVALLVIAVAWLVVWNVYGQYKAKVNNFVHGVFQVGNQLISFFSAIVEFITNPNDGHKNKLIGAIGDLVETLSIFIDGSRANTIGKLLTNKIDLYTDIIEDKSKDAREKINNVNKRIGAALTNTKTTQENIIKILNDIDDVLLDPNNSQIRRTKPMVRELIVYVLKAIDLDI